MITNTFIQKASYLTRVWINSFILMLLSWREDIQLYMAR